MKNRNAKGSQLIEFPIALFVLLILVFFSLLDLSSLLLGVNNIHNAARIAASDSARAGSFAEIKQRAEEKVNAGVGAQPIDELMVSVMEVPIQSSIPDPEDESKSINLESSQILPGPSPIIDTSLYQYQVQVRVTASVLPLANLSALRSLFGEIPGLTAPLKVAAKYSSIAEHPQDLAI
ncbi:MAG: hypothetical protein K2X27_28440 [Candidatus Obscuribacterales bacterium]|nr:hypothetical protein [Candidatus Obscuribacterales bacterium]